MHNKFVAVIVNGELSAWTGRNPDRYPEDKQKAIRHAYRERCLGKKAYPVVIEEILESVVKADKE